MAEQLAAEQRTRDAHNDQQGRQLEDTLLKDAVKDKSGEEAENTVYFVLRQRHMKEAIHLEDQLARQRKARLAATRAEIRDKRAEQREKLQAAYDKV